MKKICNISALLALLSLSILLTSGCTCGFDCSSDDEDSASPTALTLLFSDSLPEELKEVVLSVDRIELVRDTGETIDVDTFSIASLNADNADNFEIDLLTINGETPLVVFEALTLTPDFYDEINIHINTANPDLSYVKDSQDRMSPLTVAGDVLSLSGRQFNTGALELVIEFGLAQALHFVSEEVGYRLTTDGLRLENTATTVNLRGTIDSELLDTTTDCDDKTDPLSFNRVYIYEGSVDSTALADVFSSDSDTVAPNAATAPFAVASLQPSTQADTPLSYFFSYLPKGDYTLAFACNAEDDDPTHYDGITIAEPSDQVYLLSLPTSGETYECNLSTELDCDAQ